MAFIIPRLIIRKISSNPRHIVLDPVINLPEEIKPKNHPGVINKQIYQIPKEITSSIFKITKDQPIKNVINEIRYFKDFLHSRKLPIEENILKLKERKASKIILEKKNKNFEQLSIEEKITKYEEEKPNIRNLLKQMVYNWSPMNYDEHLSLYYLFGCAPSNYAVLQHIFNEMHQKMPNFKPSTLFDFGSGVGTVTWAANVYWKKFLTEYFNIDTSNEMHELANAILNNGNKNAINKGVYYRQFLPSSHMIKYDLVVSAFTLFELPSEKSRFETILNLWNKTNGFLVLVEDGTKHGFKVINEARDMILALNSDPNYKDYPNAYIFSPCPHNYICPKMKSRPENALCDFEVKYILPSEMKITKVIKTTYSYVVIGKGTKPDNISQWPRLISKPKRGSKHIFCHLCSNKGNLKNIAFTKGKSSKLVYKWVKRSSWGDQLPFVEEKTENDDN